MKLLQYTPDVDIKVHEEGAIKLLCKPYQSHENGLPEWVKNAADEYARSETDKAQRVVVLIFQDGSRNQPPSISCLDFAGMTSDVIENYFRVWADPEAAKQDKTAESVLGGHGNGGKCYMTHMFDGFSFLRSVHDGKGNRYGVEGGSIRFGYIPDRESGRDYIVGDIIDELRKGFEHTKCTIESLPQEVKDVLESAKGFTLFTGVKPKEYKTKILVTKLVTSLEEHPQMIHPIQFCQIFIIANGKLMNKGKPLTLPPIEPIEGAEEPRQIQIPNKLVDPTTGNRVSTIDEDKLPPGGLILRTSRTSMRYRGKKYRHLIVFYAQSGLIGYVPVYELDIQSTYRDRIYGTCRLRSLEPYKQNDRSRLAESPLTRAINQFIIEQIKSYAEEFEEKEKRQINQKEKNEISRLNEILNKWKNRILSEITIIDWDTDDGPPPPPPPLPKGSPTRMEISVTYSNLGRGVAIRPSLKFFDKHGERIQPTPFQWISEDTNVAMVDNDLGIINTYSYGETSIYAETVDGRLVSNHVPIEVVKIHKIHIEPMTIELAAGSRYKLTAYCTLADGNVVNDVCLVWTENDSSIARVSSIGMVYGCIPGNTSVIAGDDGVLAEQLALINVIEGKGGGKGKGFPIVLVSGEYDPDPYTTEYVNFSSEDPPVCQRPMDVELNIWWINSSAPLAQLYLDINSGYGFQSREWRMYHIERFIDVIVQIALTQKQKADTEPMKVQEWVLQWGITAAEVQRSAAANLQEFITSGEISKDI